MKVEFPLNVRSSVATYEIQFGHLERVFDERGVEQGIGGFIAIRDETPGLVIGTREPAMGLRGIPETEVLFEEMEVPADRVLMPRAGSAAGSRI